MLKIVLNEKKTKCAHLVFGESNTINSAYFKIFKLDNLDQDFDESLAYKIKNKIKKALSIGIEKVKYMVFQTILPNLYQYIMKLK